jgi:hypothetical protein
MAAARGISKVGPRRIIALFVLEHAVEDKDFLAAGMFVVVKYTAGFISHDAGGSRHLAAQAIHRTTQNPRSR